MDISFSFPTDKQYLIGHWAAPGVTLAISGNGKVEFHEVVSSSHGSTTRTISGAISRFDGASFVVGDSGNRSVFTVSAGSAESSLLTVNGIALKRVA